MRRESLSSHGKLRTRVTGPEIVTAISDNFWTSSIGYVQTQFVVLTMYVVPNFCGKIRSVSYQVAQ